nr:CrcB family protein [Micromonospora sp. DSM 115978]
MTTLLLVLTGGAAGALCRFLVDRAVSIRLPGNLPWGTLVVNIAGSLLLGLLAGGSLGAHPALPDWLAALAGTGFCGALTTYSTFSYETLKLAVEGGETDHGRPAAGRAALNVAVTLAVGIGAAAVGWLLTATLLT